MITEIPRLHPDRLREQSKAAKQVKIHKGTEVHKGKNRNYLHKKF